MVFHKNILALVILVTERPGIGEHINLTSRVPSSYDVCEAISINICNAHCANSFANTSYQLAGLIFPVIFVGVIFRSQNPVAPIVISRKEDVGLVMS